MRLSSLSHATDELVIFYTDDDADDRIIFEEAIGYLSHKVRLTTQASGDELLQRLENPPPKPSIIFLDLNMPVKNGYEVLKEIRQKKNLADLPVVIFSTSDDADAITTSQRLGASLYVPKPSTFSSLKKAISHTLSIDWKNFSPSKETFVFKAS